MKIKQNQFYTTILMILTVCILVSCSSNKTNYDVEEQQTDSTIEKKEILEIDYNDLETYLIKNQYHNLVLVKKDYEDSINKIVEFESYIPISPTKCEKSEVSINCEYDEENEKWIYGDISTTYIGVTNQPRVTLSINTQGVGKESITVPFSWGYTVDYENYYSLLFNYDKSTNKEAFKEYFFYFQNSLCLIVNYMMSVDPFNPDFTKEYNVNDYGIMHAFYNNDDDLGNLLIYNNDAKNRLLLSFGYISKEEQLEIAESIILDNNSDEMYDSLGDKSINYNKQMFEIKLKYNMRLRSARNQFENVIRMAKEGETFPVYKVINDGKFIWYCVGQDMWIGDDGTCLDILEDTIS